MDIKVSPALLWVLGGTVVLYILSKTALGEDITNAAVDAVFEDDPLGDYDYITKQHVLRLVPEFRVMVEEFLGKAKAAGYTITITSSVRGNSEQQKLYDQGRVDKTKPIVTNAKPGQSAHNYAAAIDFAFLVNGSPSWDGNLPWAIIGALGESCGMVWGGSFRSIKDRPHFEHPNWKTFEPVA